MLTLERDIDEHFGRSSRYLVRISRPFRGSGDSSQASNTVDVTILRRGWLRFCETAKSNLLSGTKGIRRGRVCRVLIEFRWTEIGMDQLHLPSVGRADAIKTRHRKRSDRTIPSNNNFWFSKKMLMRRKQRLMLNVGISVIVFGNNEEPISNRY